MTVTLPTPELNSGKAEWSDVYSNDHALKEAIESLQAEFKAAINPVTWYVPKIIGTEEGRTSTAFGTLSTADEITDVVVPENGLIVVGYQARFKSSVAGAGRAALFIGPNQIKIGTFGAPVVQETSTSTSAGFQNLATYSGGLASNDEATAVVTTGMILGVGGSLTGMTYAFAAADTYSVSVRFKATSGSVTAKERKLWVATLGAG
jgi:hypothetical protein